MIKYNETRGRSGLLMKSSASLLSAVIIFTAGCKSKPPVKKEKKEVVVKADKRNDFFSICESDIKSAIDVVMEEEIVKNLTHLHRMDYGGKKYYLLERENITRMIQAVTEGTYTDLVLVNKKGVIIYTMNNDDIFGKNVRSTLKDSPFYNCYIHTREYNMYIEDVSQYPPEEGRYNLFISKRYNKDTESRGVFIMQISIDIIENIFDKKTEVLNRAGKYIVSDDRNNLLTPYSCFDKINSDNFYKDHKKRFKCKGKGYKYKLYLFKNLFWIMIDESQDSS